MGRCHSLANSGPFEFVTLLGIEPRRRRCDNQTAVSRINSPGKRVMALSTWCGRLVASDARTLCHKNDLALSKCVFICEVAMVFSGPAYLVDFPALEISLANIFLIFPTGKNDTIASFVIYEIR
jgi:hypothetical protein